MNIQKYMLNFCIINWVNAAFDMGTKSNNTRIACRKLNLSIIRFNQGIIKKKML